MDTMFNEDVTLLVKGPYLNTKTYYTLKHQWNTNSLSFFSPPQHYSSTKISEHKCSDNTISNIKCHNLVVVRNA